MSAGPDLADQHRRQESQAQPAGDLPFVDAFAPGDFGKRADLSTFDPRSPKMRLRDGLNEGGVLPTEGFAVLQER